MEDDPNQKVFEDAIKNANLPKFDFDKVYDRLQEKVAKDQFVKHSWRQQGPNLVCLSCHYQHGFWVGMDKKLVGFDEHGEPILEKR